MPPKSALKLSPIANPFAGTLRVPIPPSINVDSVVVPLTVILFPVCANRPYTRAKGGVGAEVPLVPEEPEVPDEPSTPLVPEEPSIPLVPLEPEVPDEPSTPLVPDEPSIPLVPELPSVPLEPEVPDEPSIPLVPLDPANDINSQYAGDEPGVFPVLSLKTSIEIYELPP